MRPRTKVVGVLVVLLATLAGSAMLLRTLRHGFSAQDEPSRIETVLARTMRAHAAPRPPRGRKTPGPATQEVLAEARAHFADHCATCHGNDGKGQSAIGPNLYPKGARIALPQTQSQS